MSIDVNVTNDLVIVTETTEDITVNVSNAAGPQGPAGQGVPVGGTTNQVLKKLSNTNYDTYWALDGGGVPYSGATGDVNLGTHRILAQNATIASSGSGDTVTLNHTSGSGIGLNITKGGNGEGLYVNKTGGSGNAATIIGTLNATTLVKSGGTSAQILAADGSVITAGTNITISGGTISSSGGGGMAIGGAITSATAGSVLFAGTSGVLQQDNANLFWDDSNNRLLVGSTLFSDTNTSLTIGGSGTGQRVAAAGSSNYQDMLFVKTDIASGNINNWSFGQRNDTYFGNQAMSFQIVGGYMSNAGVSSAVGGGFRVPIICNPDGSVIIAGANNSINSNVLIGTVTNSTYKLDVNGNARISDTFFVSKNSNANLTIGISNKTSGASSQASLFLESDTSSGVSTFGKFSTTATVYKIINAKDAYIYNNTVAGDIALLNDFATGKIKFASGGVSTAQMTLTSAGRLLLGTTTESTFLLDVNGTARVSGNLTTGNGSGYGHSGQVVYSTSLASNAYFEASSASGAFAAVTFTKAGALSTMWQVGCNDGNDFYIFRNGINRFIARIYESTKNFGISSDSITSDIPSAQLFVNSTTKGFLPPRMTNAQRTAISSPAVGLIVYCTDAVEGLYVYKSMGWTFVI